MTTFCALLADPYGNERSIEFLVDEPCDVVKAVEDLANRTGPPTTAWGSWPVGVPYGPWRVVGEVVEVLREGG